MSQEELNKRNEVAENNERIIGAGVLKDVKPKKELSEQEINTNFVRRCIESPQINRHPHLNLIKIK